MAWAHLQFRAHPPNREVSYQVDAAQFLFGSDPRLLRIREGALCLAERALWAFPEPPTHNLLQQTVYQTIGRLRFFFLTVDPATGRVLASCQRSDSAKLAFRPRFVRFGFFGMDGTG